VFVAGNTLKDIDAASIDRYAIVESTMWFDIFGGDARTPLKSLSRKGDRRHIGRNRHAASGLHSHRRRADTSRHAHFSIAARAHSQCRPNCGELSRVQQIWQGLKGRLARAGSHALARIADRSRRCTSYRHAERALLSLLRRLRRRRRNSATSPFHRS